MIKYRIYFTRKDFLINKMQFDIKYSISKAICIIKCFRKVCSNGNELALHNVLETGDFFQYVVVVYCHPQPFFFPFLHSFMIKFNLNFWFNICSCPQKQDTWNIFQIVFSRRFCFIFISFENV